MTCEDRIEAIVALCEATAWAADLDDVYQRIVDAAAVYLECDEAHLHLLDFDGKILCALPCTARRVESHRAETRTPRA